MSDRVHAYSAKDNLPLYFPKNCRYVQNEAFLQRQLSRHPKAEPCPVKYISHMDLAATRSDLNVALISQLMSAVSSDQGNADRC